METPFEYSDYKRFLLAIEASRKSFERGFRSRLAKKVGCQSGYITHVLGGSAHFSLEQGIRVADYLSLKKNEKKYFVLLIELARAGTKELKSFFEDELRALKEEYLNIKERVGSSQVMTEADQMTYYSSWHYAAVHVLSSLPDFSDVKSISSALNIPERVTKEVLLFLVRAGIVEEKNGRLKPGLKQVHLSRESSLIRQHHTNWRIAAVQSLMNDLRTDVHYSTVSTMSKAHAEELRSAMVKMIESYVQTVKSSESETMVGFNLDFYSMIKS